MILNGFIKKCLPYGCFVEFVNNLVALAPNKVCISGCHGVAKDHMIPCKQYLKDEFVSDGNTVYKEGQSVRGKVCHLRSYDTVIELSWVKRTNALYFVGDGVRSREAEISGYPSML